jgi:hypothetical protein
LREGAYSYRKKLKEYGSTLLVLFLFSAGAVLVQGYHVGTDDAEIYIPAIKQITNPQLYPLRAEFFLMHARYAHLAQIVGRSARILHMQADTAILLWHLLGVFLMIFAGWRLAGSLFTSSRSVWAAVGALALTFSVPVAGTALAIADPYLTSRSLSTPLSLMALTSFLRGGRVSVIVWLLLTGLVHPQMVVYTVGLIAFLMLPLDRLSASLNPRRTEARAGFLVLPSLLKSFSLRPATGQYREILYSRTFFFASMWRWWEWVGVAVPLAVLLACARINLRGVTAACARVCRALFVFGLFSTFVEILFSTSTRFDSFERLQPMRSFDLIYIVFFMILGGLLAEYLLLDRIWRWLALFVPLAAGMFVLNIELYSSSPHVELPGRAGNNPWVASFYWIRANTPMDAFFALDPKYLELPHEDEHGFRAVAERSRLADFYKDSGVATMFPELAPEWARDQRDLSGWKRFEKADFERLHRQTGVTWVVLQRAVPGLMCPYQKAGIWVCRLDR